LLSWLGVVVSSSDSSVLVDACAGDVAWFSYTALSAAEASSQSTNLWTQLHAEMLSAGGSSVPVEQAFSVRHCHRLH